MNADQLQQVAGLVLQEVVKQLPTLLHQNGQVPPSATQDHPENVPGKMSVDNEEDEDPSDDEVVNWSKIIQPRTTDPTSKEAIDFVNLLKTAPPIQDLKHQTNTLPKFTGVPEPPPPRRNNKIDSHLHNVEQKLCTAMNLLTNYLETNDQSQIGTAAAWIRSAQQDTREQRRALIAGKQAWKLDPRQDDEKPRLLSAEEEKRIKPQGKGKGKGGWQSQHSMGNYNDKQQFQSRPTFWRSRSKSRDRGKGKGGKGKNQEQK